MTINSLQLVVVNPALDTIEVIADALKVEVEKLFAFATTADGARPPTEVPFAQDGAYFGRSTFRPRTLEYNLGEKGAGNTKRFKNYDNALAYLRNMNPPKWWRPDGKARWGLVTGVKWKRSPDDEST